MPRYFFDIKNGHRLIDPAGLDCRDDREANAQASSLGQAIAAEVPNVAGVRRIAVLNSQREEISMVPIEEKENQHGGEQAGRRRQRPEGRGEKKFSAADQNHGQEGLTKRDRKTGEFMDQKKAPAKKKFKGVRREKA
jgi:hypothetical protein